MLQSMLQVTTSNSSTAPASTTAAAQSNNAVASYMSTSSSSSSQESIESKVKALIVKKESNVDPNSLLKKIIKELHRRWTKQSRQVKSICEEEARLWQHCKTYAKPLLGPINVGST